MVPYSADSCLAGVYGRGKEGTILERAATEICDFIEDESDRGFQTAIPDCVPTVI